MRNRASPAATAAAAQANSVMPTALPSCAGIDRLATIRGMAPREPALAAPATSGASPGESARADGGAPASRAGKAGSENLSIGIASICFRTAGLGKPIAVAARPPDRCARVFGTAGAVVTRPVERVRARVGDTPVASPLVALGADAVEPVPAAVVAV